MKSTCSDTQDRAHQFSCRPQAVQAPVWNPNGRELIYTEPMASTNDPSRLRYNVMSVPMADPSASGKPQRLFETNSAVLPFGPVCIHAVLFH